MNKCMFIGRLTNDVDFNEEKKYARFSLALNERKNENETEVHYVNLVAFGKKAEFVKTYLKKGMKIYVESKFRQNQEKREQYSFVLEEVEFLEKKPKEEKEEEFPFNE